MRKYKPIQPNDRFGRLTVISRSDRKGAGWHFWWNCLCNCGNEKQVSDNKLQTKQVRSCGCLRRETCSAIGKTNRTHGEGIHGQETIEFRTWLGIISRTTNPNDPRWRYYGAQGVRVDDRWRRSFESFITDVGRRPSDKHSIDRYPDPNGNYELGNVRWATPKEQGRNRRNNRLLTIDGETHCHSEWEELNNLPPRIISKRISQGWPEDVNLLRPSLRATGDGFKCHA